MSWLNTVALVQSGNILWLVKSTSCGFNLTCNLQVILHTGDMRWQPRLADHPALKACKVELLYLDTTYCLPKHVFPSQASLQSDHFGVMAVERQHWHVGTSLCRLLG